MDSRVYVAGLLVMAGGLLMLGSGYTSRGFLYTALGYAEPRISDFLNGIYKLGGIDSVLSYLPYWIGLALAGTGRRLAKGA